MRKILIVCMFALSLNAQDQPGELRTITAETPTIHPATVQISEIDRMKVAAMMKEKELLQVREENLLLHLYLQYGLTPQEYGVSTGEGCSLAPCFVRKAK